MHSLGRPPRIAPIALALLTAACALAAAPASRADDAAAPDRTTLLEQRLDALRNQVEALTSELAALKARNASAAPVAAAPTAEVATPLSGVGANGAIDPVTGLPRAAAPAAAAPVSGISPDLSLWGYGEIYYTHPTHDGRLTQFDLARAVFGIGYHFDDRTFFNSEFEVEHAVASAEDRGEFEVEQFYVDRRLDDDLGLKAGLFLMPFGFLNEHHEPTAYYGVQRNFVETLVIPSTWREGGVGLHGITPAGLGWDVGVTSGIDLNGWDPNPATPPYRTALDLENTNVAPLQATHQELQLASAQNLSQYVSLNYSGVPGLLAGAAVFTGKAATPTAPAGLPDERVTLWETHARWTPGNADLQAVYARGTISHTAAYNLDHFGAANPLPAEFLGYYLQGAYTVWQRDEYRLVPFVRFERYDLGASFEGVTPGYPTRPGGLAADGKPWPVPQDRVWTVGANFYVTPHVVFKADYQRFGVNTDFTRADLGLGLAF